MSHDEQQVLEWFPFHPGADYKKRFSAADLIDGHQPALSPGAQLSDFVTTNRSVINRRTSPRHSISLLRAVLCSVLFARSQE